jgi:hypothetical protein
MSLEGGIGDEKPAKHGRKDEKRTNKQAPGYFGRSRVDLKLWRAVRRRRQRWKGRKGCGEEKGSAEEPVDGDEGRHFDLSRLEALSDRRGKV